MTTDWKDMLSGLKSSGSLAEDNTPDTENTEVKRAESLPKKGKLQIFYEKKGRAGKPATIITGFDPDFPEEAAEVASTLKKRLGCGGSARGGEILLQGDRREQVRPLLAALGYLKS